MNNDWRLTNQTNYLYKKVLKKQPFKVYKEGWEHEHCEFCSERIDKNTPVAYSSDNNYYWICEKCYEDFKDMFEWTVEE